MTFLFGSHLSLREKLKVVAKLAGEHASNLAAFACLYKVWYCICCNVTDIFHLILISQLSLLTILYLSLGDVGRTQSSEPKN